MSGYHVDLTGRFRAALAGCYDARPCSRVVGRAGIDGVLLGTRTGRGTYRVAHQTEAVVLRGSDGAPHRLLASPPQTRPGFCSAPKPHASGKGSVGRTGTTRPRHLG